LNLSKQISIKDVLLSESDKLTLKIKFLGFLTRHAEVTARYLYEKCFVGYIFFQVGCVFLNKLVLFLIYLPKWTFFLQGYVFDLFHYVILSKKEMNMLFCRENAAVICTHLTFSREFVF